MILLFFSVHLRIMVVARDGTITDFTVYCGIKLPQYHG